MSNSVDPDETAHDEPSHLDLRSFQKRIIIAYGSERVTCTCKDKNIENVVCCNYDSQYANQKCSRRHFQYISLHMVLLINEHWMHVKILDKQIESA